VPLAAVAAAVRLLAERHRVIAEGAGAAAVAVALAPWTAAATGAGGSRGATGAAGGGGTAAGADAGGSIAASAAGRAPAPGEGGVPRARKIVCIVSGGNIDAAKLAVILAGGVP
jgi:threonine dehydratase